MEALLVSDPDVATGAELGEMSRHSAKLRAFADYVDIRVNRRSRELVAADAADTGTHALIDDGRLTGKEAKATEGRDRVCSEMPQFDDALATGECTAGHIDAMAQHTKDLTDEERADLAVVLDDLLADAATQPVALFDKSTKATIDRIREIHRPGNDADELDRQRGASIVKRWTDLASGMKNTLISLDPLRDASLHAIIDAHLASLRNDPANKERPFDELKVEAVMNAVSAGQPTQQVAEIVVHVDHESLCHGRHDRTVSETIDGQPLPISTVQRLCCEALLQAVVVQPDGTVDRICAEQRTASRAQRRQLAAMYASCAHPLCEVGFSNCRIHHIRWFSRGGKTVLANMVPLCETHHHLVHEGGWNLVIDNSRHLSWIRPDGITWKTNDGPNRRPRTRPPDRADPPLARSA